MTVGISEELRDEARTERDLIAALDHFSLQIDLVQSG